MPETTIEFTLTEYTTPQWVRRQDGVITAILTPVYITAEELRIGDRIVHLGTVDRIETDPCSVLVSGIEQNGEAFGPIAFRGTTTVQVVR